VIQQQWRPNAHSGEQGFGEFGKEVNIGGMRSRFYSFDQGERVDKILRKIEEPGTNFCSQRWWSLKNKNP
jgi:hypothetical protein